jgi:hypothetical protein
MTLAITRLDASGNAVVVCVRERRPPFSPEQVVSEFAVLLKSYGVHEVVGDRYGGEWPRERFQYHGIRYVVSDRTKSEIYVAFLPLLNSKRVELLDNARLIAQLCQLERRVARSGRDSIDHAPGGHDDLINATAGAVCLTTTARPALRCTPELIASIARHPRYERNIDLDWHPYQPGSMAELRFLRMQRAAQRRY